MLKIYLNKKEEYKEIFLRVKSFFFCIRDLSEANIFSMKFKTKLMLMDFCINGASGID